MSTAKDVNDVPKMIIYTHTKDVICKVFSHLRKSAPKKHWICMCHASLTEKTKMFMQHQFQNNESQLRCLVATIGFGMVCVACCLLNGLNIGISITLFYRAWTSQILNQYLYMAYLILWSSFTRCVVNKFYTSHT